MDGEGKIASQIAFGGTADVAHRVGAPLLREVRHGSTRDAPRFARGEHATITRESGTEGKRKCHANFIGQPPHHA
jgi:hypothetical protein